jgi:hypothetical protein
VQFHRPTHPPTLRTKPRLALYSAPHPREAVIMRIDELLPTIGPGPCQGCEHARRCSAGLACTPFAQWVHSGREPGPTARLPNAAIYARLFPARDSDRIAA